MRYGSSPDMTEIPVSVEHLSSARPFSTYACFQALLSRSGDPRSFCDASGDLLLRNLGSLDRNNIANTKESAELLTRVQGSQWTLALCQWESNVNYLKDAFQLRRYSALVRPGMRTYLPLVHLRQLIVGLRDCILAAQHVSSRSDNSFDDLFDDHALFDDRRRQSRLIRPSLSDTLAQAADSLNKLDKELNDEIHLIIGVVTVQDSAANRTQTESATLLTLLAAVYLPLTLVTGIFGMNIKDINDGSPSWRACGIVFVVVAACTIVFVWAHWQWRVRRRGQQERERSEYDFQKDV